MKGEVNMIQFHCDYTEGAHPKILEKLYQTNMEQLPGYGKDHYCASAIKKIRTACGRSLRTWRQHCSGILFCFYRYGSKKRFQSKNLFQKKLY